MRLGGVALALVLLPVAAAAPEQVRIGIPSADPTTQLAVQWLDAQPEQDPKLTLTTPDGPKTVAASLVPGPTLGFVYEARLTGLAPGTEYAYEVGGRSFSLRTPPADGSLRFVALGDMATTAQAQATVDEVLALGPDFVLHMGDISYAEGDPLVWRDWFAMTEPVAASVPWIPAAGNHDVDVQGRDTSQGALVDPRELAFYKQRFRTPGEDVYYSWDAGGVHFVALDSYAEVRISPDQVAWLKADLAAAKDAAWRIVYLHEPFFSSNSHGSSQEVQDAFLQAIEEGGVDLVLQAHDHGYERSWPMRAGKPTVSSGSTFEQGAGTVYVVSGGAGASLYATWEEPQPAWSAVRGSFHHVALLEATPETLSLRVVPTVESDDAVEDSFTIRRAAADPPGAVPGATTDRATPTPAWLALAAAAVALALRRRR
ncbi:MAG TPA: metallophosphoesterase family protein [Candidatus Thermoplasmatota archaeon]|nr:metallophosphoesterase family protein [Candidatus Thermoplasmatota archaeon]